MMKALVKARSRIGSDPKVSMAIAAFATQIRLTSAAPSPPPSFLAPSLPPSLPCWYPPSSPGAPCRQGCYIAVGVCALLLLLLVVCIRIRRGGQCCWCRFRGVPTHKQWLAQAPAGSAQYAVSGQWRGSHIDARGRFHKVNEFTFQLPARGAKEGRVAGGGIDRHGQYQMTGSVRGAYLALTKKYLTNSARTVELRLAFKKIQPSVGAHVAEILSHVAEILCGNTFYFEQCIRS